MLRPPDLLGSFRPSASCDGDLVVDQDVIRCHQMIRIIRSPPLLVILDLCTFCCRAVANVFHFGFLYGARPSSGPPPHAITHEAGSLNIRTGDNYPRRRGRFGADDEVDRPSMVHRVRNSGRG